MVILTELDKKKLSLIQIPTNINRFVKIGELNKYVTIESIIIYLASYFFQGSKITNIGLFRIIRDSELEYSDEDDLLVHLRKSLKKRRQGEIISFSYMGLNKDSISKMESRLKIRNQNFIVKKNFLGFFNLSNLIDLINDKNLDVLINLSNGSLGKAIELINNEECFNVYSRAKDIITNFKKISKKEIDDFFSLFNNNFLFEDFLLIIHINIFKHLLNRNKYNYTQITGPKTNKKLISSNHEIINCNVKSSFLRSYS